MHYNNQDISFAPHYEIVARIKTAIELSGKDFDRACRDAHTTPGEVQFAVEHFEQNPQAHLHVLNKLERSLCIPTGAFTSVQRVRLSQTREKAAIESALKLTWEYIYKRFVPRDRWGVLLEEVRRRVQSLQSASPSQAFRAGVPASWQDVGKIYRQLFGEDAA